jgi:hypothetical protein
VLDATSYLSDAPTMDCPRRIASIIRNIRQRELPHNRTAATPGGARPRIPVVEFARELRGISSSSSSSFSSSISRLSITRTTTTTRTFQLRHYRAAHLAQFLPPGCPHPEPETGAIMSRRSPAASVYMNSVTPISRKPSANPPAGSSSSSSSSSCSTWLVSITITRTTTRTMRCGFAEDLPFPSESPFYRQAFPWFAPGFVGALWEPCGRIGVALGSH